MTGALRAILLGFLLVLPVPGACAGEAATDSPVQRFETVFFVTLPFASLYSGAITLVAAAIIQKGRVDFTLPYQVTTISLAALGAGWSAWRDAKSGGPDLKRISLEGTRDSCQSSVFSCQFSEGRGILGLGVFPAVTDN